MGKTFEAVDAKLQGFIEKQKMFFVATAPRSDEGLVNLSPKGLDGTLAILDGHTIAYLDLTGSGVETIAHLRENGRICLMFCAFEGPPRIVRIHGTGEVLEPGDLEFDELIERFANHPGARAIIRIRASRISDSCGFGVPLYDYRGERDQLQRWAEKKGPEGIAQYQRDNNMHSLDGLPSGLRHH